MSSAVLRRSCLYKAALLLVLAPAPAAAQWSVPAPVPGAVDTFAHLQFAPSGRGVLSWYDVNGDLFAQTVDGGFAPPRLATRLRDARIAGLYEGERALIVGRGRESGRPLAAVGPLDGPHGVPVPIGPRRSIPIAAAVNRRGDAAVVLIRCRNEQCSSNRPYLAALRAGRALRVRRLATRPSRTSSAGVTIDERGRYVAAWERPLKGRFGRRAVYARRGRAGRRPGRVFKLGEAATIPSFSLSGSGNGVVGWSAQPVSEGHALGPAVHQVAIGRRRGFARTRRLERVDVTGTGRYIAGPRLRITGTTAVWTGHDGGRFVVRTDDVADDAPPTTLPQPEGDAILSALAGTTVIATAGIGGADPTGSTWLYSPQAGAVEAITRPEVLPDGVTAAQNPATGAVWVVYRNVNAGRLDYAVRH